MSKKRRKGKNARARGAGAIHRHAENASAAVAPPDARPVQTGEAQREPQAPIAEPTPTREHHGRARHVLVEVVRFALAVVALVVLQLLFEKAVFLKIDEESEFKREVVEALELLEPLELGKLLLEASTSYEEPIVETPEYASCLKRMPDRASDCAAEARHRRHFVKVPPEQYGGMVPPNDPTWKPFIGACRVLAYLYFGSESDGQRFVAVLQLIVGFAASCVAAFWYFQRERTHNAADDVKHLVPVILILLFGTLIGASVLAYPIRLLGLIAFGFITGTYGAVLMRLVEKSLDAILHRRLERLFSR